MADCKFMGISVLFLVLVSNTVGAPVSTINPNPYTIKEKHHYESTTNKINPSTEPLTELIQLQTDAIKKILSTSLHSSNQDLPNPKNKCEDIESGIKESIRKSNAQEEIIINNVNKEQSIEIASEDIVRGDSFTEETTIKPEKNYIPNGRTLFSLYRDDVARSNGNTTPAPSTFIPENQNVILVPCIKRIVHNDTRRDSEEIQDTNYQQPDAYALSKNYQPQQTNEQLIHSIDANQKYVLEKVYAPNGYLLYYMYRPRNLNPEQPKVDYTSPTTVSIAPTSTITTTTSTPTTDSMYKEQLKFVVQMPFTEPEQLMPYGYKFDPYAYYPSELQPSYVNGPIQYKPTFHMIRTLVVPNEYNNIHQNNGE